MKKYIITGLFLLLITYVYMRKIINSIMNLDYSVEYFRLRIKNAADILTGFMDGFTADLRFTIRNTTNMNFNLDNLYLEIYTLTGSLIARPEQIINQIKIPKNADAPVNMTYKISPSGLYKFLENSTKTEVIQMLKNYIQTGYFGKKILVKGKAKKYFANINFTYELEI